MTRSQTWKVPEGSDTAETPRRGIRVCSPLRPGRCGLWVAGRTERVCCLWPLSLTKGAAWTGPRGHRRQASACEPGANRAHQGDAAGLTIFRPNEVSAQRQCEKRSCILAHQTQEARDESGLPTPESNGTLGKAGHSFLMEQGMWQKSPEFLPTNPSGCRVCAQTPTDSKATWAELLS